MNEWTPEAVAEHELWMAGQVAKGRCPYSGLAIVSCKASDLCDCFDIDDPRKTEPIGGYADQEG